MKNNSLKIILFLISIAIFGYHLTSLLIHWSEIPNEIPIHFQNGEPNNWGPKYLLFILPGLSIILWHLIGLLTKNSKKLNYVNLTEKNKEQQYKRVGNMLVLVQYFSATGLVLLNETFLRELMGMDASIALYTAIILLAACVILPFYYLFWAATLKY